MNVYGIYQNIRDAAWQCLIDYEITSLPVNLLAITKAAGIKVIKNSEVNELSGDESAIALLENDTWFIVYDDECGVGRRRFSVAHELGHIFLGHELLKGYHKRAFNKDKPQMETDADMFAIRLLAPACVLWGLGIHTGEDIARVCAISNTAAKYRAERMALLYQRQMFLTSPLEKKVFGQFKEFIQEAKNNYP